MQRNSVLCENGALVLSSDCLCDAVHQNDRMNLARLKIVPFQSRLDG